MSFIRVVLSVETPSSQTYTKLMWGVSSFAYLGSPVNGEGRVNNAVKLNVINVE